MTQLVPNHPLPSRRTAWKLGLGMAARIALSMVLLFGAYFLLPTKSVGTEESDLPYFALALLVFGAVVGTQVPAIIKSRYPILRAIEALTLVIAFYLLIFARIYLSNSLGDPGVFNHPLNHTTALYFTVTVFATVGFGDFIAATDGMRGLVTIQMLLNLVVLGLIIRLLSSAAQRGVAKRHAPQPGTPAATPRDPAAPDPTAPDPIAPDPTAPDRPAPLRTEPEVRPGQ